MPLSPSQAIGQSAAARLNDVDKLELAEAKTRIDGILSTQFSGRPVQFQTPVLSMRVVGALERAYGMAGWNVGAVALDGTMAKAGEMLERGMDCQWQMTLVPDWGRGS